MDEEAARTRVRVGAAVEVVTPQPGRVMGGYASRTATAEGTLDDLFCRVVVLSQARTTLALVAFDLLYVPAQLAHTVATDVARTLTIAPENVLVSATHTHCGPAIAGPGSATLLSELAAAALRCTVAAQRAGARAQLFRTDFSVAGLVHHRREPAEDVDDTGTVLLAVSETSGEVIASVVSMACHPTVLDGDTIAYSRDYPGVVCDIIETVCGGRAIFLQGFAGDTNPIFHDHSPEDMRLFGRQIGARAADAVLSTQRATRDNRTINLSRGTSLPVAMPPPARGVAPVELRGQMQQVRVDAKAPVERATIRSELHQARQAVAEASTPAEHDAAAALEARWWIEDLIYDNAPYLGIDVPSRTDDTLPVQVLTLGPALRIVAFPGEPLHGAATKLRDSLGDEVILVGYAHRAASYLPCIEDFDHLGYEVGSTRYEPGAVERLIDAATAMAHDKTTGMSP